MTPAKTNEDLKNSWEKFVIYDIKTFSKWSKICFRIQKCKTQAIQAPIKSPKST